MRGLVFWFVLVYFKIPPTFLDPHNEDKERNEKEKLFHDNKEYSNLSVCFVSIYKKLVSNQVNIKETDMKGIILQGRIKSSYRVISRRLMQAILQ